MRQDVSSRNHRTGMRSTVGSSMVSVGYTHRPNTGIRSRGCGSTIPWNSHPRKGDVMRLDSEATVCLGLSVGVISYYILNFAICK